MHGDGRGKLTREQHLLHGRMLLFLGLSRYVRECAFDSRSNQHYLKLWVSLRGQLCPAHYFLQAMLTA